MPVIGHVYFNIVFHWYSFNVCACAYELRNASLVMPTGTQFAVQLRHTDCECLRQ